MFGNVRGFTAPIFWLAPQAGVVRAERYILRTGGFEGRLEARERKSGDPVKLVRVGAGPKAFLPFQEPIIQSSPFVFVANAKVEKLFALVAIMDQPIEKIIKSASLTS